MQCLFMEKKINYYLESLKEIEALNGKRPTLLLHACCGPCLTFPIKFLSQYFDVTVFYNNSNIYPESEYQRRKDELKKFLEYFYKDYNVRVEVIETPYDNDTYNKDLEPYKNQPEGLDRCKICYTKRMDEAFRYANEHKFDYFTTVMTISRQKNSQILNAIGKELEKKYNYTKYFYSDFKKNKGIDEAREMRIKYNLYQQLYCGCKYTYHKQFLVKNHQKEEQK